MYGDGIYKIDEINNNIYVDIVGGRYEKVTCEVVEEYLCKLGYRSRFKNNFDNYVNSMNSILEFIPKESIVTEYKYVYKVEDSLYTIITPANEDEYKTRIYELRDIVFKEDLKFINVILPYEGIVKEENFEEFDELIYGNCLSLGNSIHNSLVVLENKELPIQVTFDNFIHRDPNKILRDIYDTKKLVKLYKMQVFVHGPNYYNLSNPSTTNAEQMGKQFILAKQCGFKGVIFHVGKALKLSNKHALQYMFEIILRCLPYASKECPFLLETPAGQGTETLRTIEEFTDFVRRVITDSPEEYKDHFGICIDTCHVFATGYLPIDYINNILYDINGNPNDIANTLKLIHLNDSKNDKGCCKDRHQKIGKGKIGVGQFIQIININKLHNIPLIFEFQEK